MAIYILIKKTFENAHFAEYIYGEDENSLGKMEIEKQSGRIIVTEEAPNDNGLISQRAGHKIFLHWKAGEFPEKTCWSS